MEKRRLLESYRSSLIAVERRAALTVEAYVSEIGRFLDWAQERGRDPETVAVQDLTEYLAQRRVQALDSRSIAKAISALRSFFRYLVGEGARVDNPAAYLERPRAARRLPSVLPARTIEQLLSVIDCSTPYGLRDRCLFELIYSAGLRVSEAVSLDVTDIYFPESLARVRGKGSKERLVPFGPDARDWLKKYLESSRPRLSQGKRSAALFLNRNGSRLSRKGIWKNYAVFAGQVGTSSKLHTLRHSYATELLAGGADLRSVQELLGHADLGTTQIYTHVDPAVLREQHRRYLPPLRGGRHA